MVWKTPTRGIPYYAEVEWTEIYAGMLPLGKGDTGKQRPCHFSTAE